jgi:hypothetical protein
MLVAIGCIPFGLLDLNCIYRSYANGLCSLRDRSGGADGTALVPH